MLLGRSNSLGTLSPKLTPLMVKYFFTRSQFRKRLSSLKHQQMPHVTTAKVVTSQEKTGSNLCHVTVTSYQLLPVRPPPKAT